MPGVCGEKPTIDVTLQNILKMTEEIIEAYNIQDLEKQGYTVDEEQKQRCRQCLERLDCVTAVTKKTFMVPGWQKAYCMSYNPDWEKIAEQKK